MSMANIASLFFLLIAGHALGDYPLQGDFLARGKNHITPIPGIPWWQCLAAHALIQAGIVLLVLHGTIYFVLEFVAHWLIDYGKSAGHYGFDFDQALHLACKLAWLTLFLGTLP